jgi:Rap1a immunity proteins
MSRLVLLAALAFAALPVSAHAQRPLALHARTAGELAELCTASLREPAGEAKLNYCHGFAQGVVDLELMHGRPFCIPQGTSREATLAEFARWVGAQADRRETKAVTALLHFLAERYPCH